MACERGRRYRWHRIQWDAFLGQHGEGRSRGCRRQGVRCERHRGGYHTRAVCRPKRLERCSRSNRLRNGHWQEVPSSGYGYLRKSKIPLSLSEAEAKGYGPRKVPQGVWRNLAALLAVRVLLLRCRNGGKPWPPPWVNSRLCTHKKTLSNRILEASAPSLVALGLFCRQSGLGLLKLNANRLLTGTTIRDARVCDSCGIEVLRNVLPKERARGFEFLDS